MVCDGSSGNWRPGFDPVEVELQMGFVKNLRAFIQKDLGPVGLYASLVSKEDLVLLDLHQVVEAEFGLIQISSSPVKGVGPVYAYIGRICGSAYESEVKPGSYHWALLDGVGQLRDVDVSWTILAGRKAARSLLFGERIGWLRWLPF